MSARDDSATGPVATSEARPQGARGNLLPADDPGIFQLTLDQLADLWRDAAGASPMTAEAMTGADRRAQRMGIPGWQLMENAGAAAAAATRALVVARGRWDDGQVLILAGPGNNGGDGFVMARRLARAGARVVAVLVSSDPRPGTADAARNWDRLGQEPRVTRIHVASANDLRIVARGVEKAAVLVDALLGTGVRGALRDPVRAAVQVARRARAEGVPVVAVDTPTAVDLTSGEASDPVVRADLTVTFHRPKTGLLTRTGADLAGRVLVAPIGIPAEADRG
jgi:ADP-dependent NAD(P)H-hydrate dehydratase / NAD(P)H-hydrate epimerase